MTFFEKLQLLALKISGDIGDAALGVLFLTSSKGISKVKNVRYMDNAKTSIDFFYPKPPKTRAKHDNAEPANEACGYASEKLPVLIYIHGGGFLVGSKSSRQGYCYRWVKKGYAAVNIDYQCGAKHPFPEFLQQVFKAIELALDNAEKYKLDLNRIVLGGESAGAFIAALVSAFATNHALYDEFGIDFKYKDSFSVRANILMNGIFDVEGILECGFPFVKCLLMAFSGLGKKDALALLNTPYAKKVSPLTYVNSHFPPSVVIKSTRDALAPSSDVLTARLNELNIQNLSLACSGLSAVHIGALFTRSKSASAALAAAQDFAKNAID